MSEKLFTLSIVLTTTSLPLWSIFSMNLTDSADSDHTVILPDLNLEKWAP